MVQAKLIFKYYFLRWLCLVMLLGYCLEVTRVILKIIFILFNLSCYDNKPLKYNSDKADSELILESKDPTAPNKNYSVPLENIFRSTNF